MTDTQEFRPNWVSPPGDTIEDLLEERRWTKAEFADRTDFTPKHVNELIKGRASVTAETAERLSLVLGSTPGFWLAREAQYRAAVHQREMLETLAEQASWLRELPIAWMAKRDWIEKRRHKGEQVEAGLQYFGVASVETWRQKYAEPLAAFRTSDKFSKKIGAMASWFRQGEVRATALRCAPFVKRGLRGALAQLRELTIIVDPSEFMPRVVDICAQHGVAVVFVPAPPGCPASGATRWLAPDKALVQLSSRHKSNDHLWFTFFHEIGHILLHGKKLQFIEGMDGLDADREAEADRFAAELLISSADAARLPELEHSRGSITRFARQIGIAPGLVIGRMQKEGLLAWNSSLNRLKVRCNLDEL